VKFINFVDYISVYFFSFLISIMEFVPEVPIEFFRLKSIISFIYILKNPILRDSPINNIKIF